MRLLRDESGQAMALTGVLISLMCISMAGAAIDVGMLYRQKRIVQTAADAGALAAAAGESTSTSITAAATTAASQNGLTVVTGTPSAGQATVSATDGISGIGNIAYVHVTVTERARTFFLGALSSNFGVIPITATADASYLSSNTECMLGLSQTGTAVPNYNSVEVDGSTTMLWNTTVMADVAVAGNGKIVAPHCGVQGCGPSSEASGSGKTAASLYAAGGGSINAIDTSAPSFGIDNSGSLITSLPNIANCSGNPLSGKVPATPTPSTCSDPSWMSQHTGGGGSYTLSPGTYCNFNTQNVSNLTLQPGLYIITNTFSTNSATTITGTGVTIYIANGAIANSGNYTYVSGGSTPYGVGNGTTMNISAPTSGTYANLAIWDGNSSSSTPDTFTFGGGANSTFTGDIYAPNTNLVLGNGTGTSALNANVIANTITVQGGSTIQNNYNPTGQASTGGVSLAE